MGMPDRFSHWSKNHESCWPERLLHDLAEIGGRHIAIAVAAVVLANTRPERLGADDAAQHVQASSRPSRTPGGSDLAHVREVRWTIGAPGCSACVLRMTGMSSFMSLHERIAAVELLGEQVREVRREPLAQPHVIPVALGDGVAPPLVRHFVHDGRTPASTPFLAVHDRRRGFHAAADAGGLDVRELLVRRTGPIQSLKYSNALRPVSSKPR